MGNRCKFRLFWLAVFFAAIVVCPGLALADFTVPPYKGYVNDYANVLSPETEARMEATAQELDRKTGAQMAVLTVLSLEGRTVEEAALKTAREWGMGQKKEKMAC